MTPMTTPVVIPAKDAEYTLVNFFATWCTSSKRWLPVVEGIRQKYGSRLAVVGVANVDESTSEELTAFAKENGATFPVFADPDHKVALALRPAGWGQAIAVVDRKGVIRFVHRGTGDGAFEHVDKAIAALMAQQ
jgi:peroxiredoxin